ncbi:hypothetical protein GEO21_13720 [Sphingobacterium faecium]|uniref:hypothetical protein n=1 Tax=Sphingobacterium faecium TaxID=34087 RepID=UPI001292374C|nr:hypothetical protein [Sphingobacterium faecium]MQP28565.1 hypothetical protein [Sphingobacterium faecium]
MTDQNKEFLEFAESLKLVRRAKLEDLVNDKSIDDIYTDLLPNNGIINKLNLPRTTLLVGRKGTGKSTIFQKSQKDLIKNKKCISIYIDVKSLIDNSTPTFSNEIESHEEIHKFLIYSNMIKIIVLETRSKIKEFVDQSILEKLLGYDPIQIQRINSELDQIEKSIKDVINNIDTSLIKKFKVNEKSEKSNAVNAGVEISSNPNIKIGSNDGNKIYLEKEYESTFATYLDIKGSLISKLKNIKSILNIDHLYIFLDDYSEIDEDAQKIFMDWFIGPLNNTSDDFVKLKIAIYPHRFYYGKLDNSKIDEISLEFFDAFYTYEKESGISKMESLALDYTKRLIDKRFKLFFPNNNWEDYFDINQDELCDLLFSTTFNNPRKMGYILSYCHESCLIHGVNITKDAIENASMRYYNDVTLKYFLANQFTTKSFKNTISLEHQYQLLKKIIERQKSNCSKENRARLKGKPANHFLVNKDISVLLDNLELNGFISTYNYTKDSNDNLSIIYCLDYGLCKSYNLNFTRASERKASEYFHNPRFNMNILISEYFNKTQVIRCQNGHEFPYETLIELKRYKMRCPDCVDLELFNSYCEVTQSDHMIREQLRLIESKRNNNITYQEFLLLINLNLHKKPVSISTLSKTLDKSLETIKKDVYKLVEKALIIEDIDISRALKKDHFKISKRGEVLIAELNRVIKELGDSK